MAATIYYDADLSIIQGRRVAVLGYGNQGQAHALCLRDCGVDVRVGLPGGSRSRDRAEGDGFAVLAPVDACGDADLVMMLAPDTVQGALYAEAVRPNLVDGDAVFFSHGFTIRYGLVEPPLGIDVAMVAPKGPGPLVRRQFVDGKGVPTLVAVEQDASGNTSALALSYAKAIGGTRAGVIVTTFTEAAETSLFGEQAVLGGASALVRAGFETLVAAGYQPEIAYFECLHELKVVVDQMYEVGISPQRRSGSDVAAYGDRTRGPSIIDDHVRASMKHVLTEIQDGTFTRERVEADDAGRPGSQRLSGEGASAQLEQVGARVRSMMSWLDRPRTD